MAPRNKKNLPAETGAGKPAVQGSMDALMAQDSQESTGFENMSADDLAIPFIVILQSNSPQVKRGPAKIEGAEEGDFYNTVTQEIFKETIIIIPCAYQKCWVEWIPREQGGGFVMQHTDDSILAQCTRGEDKRDTLPSGNNIVSTAYHYCLLIKETGEVERVVLSFTSTQLKKSRRWNTQMINRKIDINGRKITPPMFSHYYTMATVEESNDQGSWCGWEISEPKLIMEPDVYMASRSFHGEASKGQVKTAPPPDAAGAVETSAEVVDNEEHF